MTHTLRTRLPLIGFRNTRTHLSSIRALSLIATLLMLGLAGSVPAQAEDPDAAGVVWVGTSQGLFKVSSETGEILLSVPQPVDADQLAVDRYGGTLWAHTDSTLHALDFLGNSIFTIPLSVTGPAAGLAVDEGDGTVWLGIGNQVMHFDALGQDLGGFSTANSVVGLGADRFNRVWVAFSSTVTAFDSTTGNPLKDLDLGKGKPSLYEMEMKPELPPFTNDYLYLVGSKGWARHSIWSTTESGGSWLSLPSGVHSVGTLAVASDSEIHFISVTNGNVSSTIPSPLQSPILDVVADIGRYWIAGGSEIARISSSAVLVLDELGAGVSVTSLVAGEREQTAPTIALAAPAAGSWISDNPPSFEFDLEDPPGTTDPRASGVDLSTLRISWSDTETGGATGLVDVTCVPTAPGARCTLDSPIGPGWNEFRADIRDFAGNPFAEGNLITNWLEWEVYLDPTAPTITITGPADGAETADRMVPIQVSYDDAGTAASGLDPASLEILVDGATWPVSCTQSASSAECTPSDPLPIGNLTIETRIEDVAGNTGTDSIGLTVSGADTFPPVVTIVSPAEGDQSTSASPSVVLGYTDLGQGIDPATVSILANGAPLAATCSMTGSAFEGELACSHGTTLPVGPVALEATITDLAGNPSAPASRSFTVVPPYTTVVGFALNPDGSPAVGAEVTLAGRPSDVTFTDASGGFVFQDLTVTTGETLTVRVELDAGGQQLAGSAPAASPVYGGTTDVSAIQLVALCAYHATERFDPPGGRLPGYPYSQFIGTVYALGVFDDGSGATLYAAGYEGGAAVPYYLARWSTAGWEIFTRSDALIRDLAVLDDGSGTALYAAGSFTSIDGVAASRIARWDGTTWSPVGGGTNDVIQTLAVVDEPGGPVLYAGGGFLQAGGVAAGRVARWDGSSWSAVGNGLDGSVLALAWFDDGSGAALHVGGRFDADAAGTVSLDHVARLSGGVWSPVGGGISGDVYTLAVHDDGTGPGLVAGGFFSTAGGVTASRIARWDGSVWSAFGSVGNVSVEALGVLDDGFDSTLYAAAAKLWQWNGSDWEIPGGGVGSTGDPVKELLPVRVSPFTAGPALFVGGDFHTGSSSVGGTITVGHKVAEWTPDCDLAPPGVDIQSPSNPTVTGQASVSLTGDLLDGVALWVDDQAIAVQPDGSFESGPVTLDPGVNAWDVTAYDAAGNRVVVPFQALLDTAAPGLSFHLPLPGETVDSRRPSVEVVYQDDHLVDPATLAFAIGGSPVAMDCASDPERAVCRPSQDLPTGAVTLTATIADLAGNPSPQAQRSFTVNATAGPSDTTVVGSVVLPGGAPAAGAQVSILGQRGSVTTAASDGTFTLPGVDASLGPITAIARYSDGSGGLAGLVPGTAPVAGGVTDVGVIELKALCDLELVSGFTSGVGVDGTYPEENPDGSDTLLSARVFALEVFDDGTGPALYVGGRFESAGGLPATGIARWDGERWSDLDGGVKASDRDAGNVYALEVFDDGTGPALYVGGSFYTVGGPTGSPGLSARGIAKWDGSSWSAVGGSTNGTVRALATVDAGDGPKLYAGGTFTSVSGTAANHVAAWDGGSWSALADGLGGTFEGVYALASYDAPKGNRQALYAGGNFLKSGSDTGIKRLAAWDGSKWAAAGGGVLVNSAGTSFGVWALTVFDGQLIAGGVFSAVGPDDLPVTGGLAAWDGRNWSALAGLGSVFYQGTAPSGGVQALTVFDDGGGAALYALGALKKDDVFSNLYRWDGSIWSVVGGGLSAGVDFGGMALTTFDADSTDGRPAELLTGSAFSLAGASGTLNVNGIASWDGTRWAALSRGVPEPVTGLVVFDAGDGPDLYAAGYSTDRFLPSNYRTYSPMRWNGHDWVSLPPLESQDAWETARAPYARIQDMAVLDDGTGPAIYAVGRFRNAGLWATPGIARWDGTQWIPYADSGLPPQSSGALDPVIDWNTVEMFNGGQGPRLVVAGAMNDWSGVVEWTGDSWRTLGEIVSSSGSDLPGFDLEDLAVFDDGSGLQSLFVVGDFAAVDGQQISYLARWDGATWSAAGDFDDLVTGLTVFDDGTGPALYATGRFQNVDGVPAQYVARWNGSSWEATGSGLPGSGDKLAVVDDGAGDRLFVSGKVEVVGGALSSGLAVWNGSAWDVVPTGIGISAGRMVGFDDGTGPALFVGGVAFHPAMSYVKKLQRPLECTAGGADTTPPTLSITSPAAGASLLNTRPSISLAYADQGSGVDTSTLSIEADGAPLAVTCSYLVSEATCTPDADLSQGSHTLSATIADAAGNVSSPAQVTFSVVAGTPSLAITSPTQGSVVLEDTPEVHIAYTENADLSTMDVQSAPTAVGFSCTTTPTSAVCTPLSPLAEGANTVTVTVSGFDGTSPPPAVADFTIDLGPPSLAFTSPADGSTTNLDPPEIHLAWSDPGVGVDPSTLVIQEGASALSVTCDTTATTAVCTLANALPEGPHTLTASVADLAGQSSATAQVSFEVVLDFEAPIITLAAPQPGESTVATAVRFTGSLSEPATLTLDGDPVTLDAANAFDHGPVALSEGWNGFELVASDAAGNITTLPVPVLRDTSPPVLAFVAPRADTYFDPTAEPFELRWGDSGSGVDPATLQITADGVPLDLTCTSCGTGVTCTAATPPSGTAVVLEATVADRAGQSALSQVTFTTDNSGDVVAPSIFLTTPVSGSVTSEPEQRFRGELSEPGTLTVGGSPTAVDANNQFDHGPVVLTEGQNAFELVATDAAGNVRSLIVTLTLDSTPPPPIDTSVVAVGQPVGGQVTVTGAAGSVTAVEPGLVVRIENRFASAVAEVAPAADGSFSAVLGAVNGDELSLASSDGVGNRSVPRTMIVPGTAVPPSDPATIAPPIDPTVATGPCGLYEFLYTGPDPVQTGVAAGAIDCRGASLVRGRVVDRSGQPIDGVRVSVLHAASLGSTLTRADGVFDFVAPGANELVFQLREAGHLPVHRVVSVPYAGSTRLPDVVLTALDPAVTPVDLSGGAASMQVAQSSEITDADGTRRATLLFPAGTSATLRYPGGATEAAASLSIRATEYTVGPDGPAAMPAALPPSSAYTYAMELSADEADAAGASSIELDRPVLSYTDNFLGFPTGLVIPVGSYDRERARWVSEENGRVIEIVSVTGGLVDLDVDGTGAPADAARLAELGVTDAERAQLATLYAVGDTLWRVRLTHFTPYDYNLPVFPPSDASAPKQPKPKGGDRDKEDKPCLQGGSIIECTNQVLGETLGLVGGPYALHYRSDRVPGRTAARTLEISLTGASPPAGVKAVELTVDVAGQRLRQSFAPGPDLTHTFTWDGLDAFGRPLQGSPSADVSVGYLYDGVYARPPDDQLEAFGRPGTDVTANPARDGVTLWQSQKTRLTNIDFKGLVGLGGWTLSPHHTYDTASRTLYYGDGGRRTVRDFTTIRTAAGTGVPGFSGDGGPAEQASFHLPNRVTLSRTLGSQGSASATAGFGYYVSDLLNCRLRRIDANGTVTTVAGSGCDWLDPELFFPKAKKGDGGPATAATFGQIGQVAEAPDGTLFIADGQHMSIRRVDPSGTVDTVIGYDWLHEQKPGETPGTQWRFDSIPYALALDGMGNLWVGDDDEVMRFTPPDYEGEIVLAYDESHPVLSQLGTTRSLYFDDVGNLYVSNWWTHFVFKLGWDGSLSPVAGGCQPGAVSCEGYSGDGGPATAAQLNYPTGLTKTADGSLLIADPENHAIRKVSPLGIITTIAGTGEEGYDGDGGTATQTRLATPHDVEVLPDGSLLIADSADHKVRRVEDVLPPPPQTGLLLIPEEDGSVRYVFDLTGRHLRTEDARTGEVLLTFGYTPDGRLASVTDSFGNVTTVERDAAGAPQAIVAAFGQRTDVTVHPSGYLETVTNPENEQVVLSYGAEGLLTGLTDPRSNSYVFEYDTLGRLKKDTDPVGGFTSLARTELAPAGAVVGGFEITKSSAIGRTTTYRTEELTTGETRYTVTDPAGLQTMSLQRNDGSSSTTLPNGVVTMATPGPDPRFGMLSPGLATLSTTTPGGLASITTASRSVSLIDPNGDPDEPANVAAVLDTVTVNGRTVTSVRDFGTRTVTITTPEGRSSLARFDTQGRTTEIQPPGIAPVLHGYDTRGRLESVTQGARTTHYDFDPVTGELTTATDPASGQVSFTYDGAGRPKTQTLLDGRSITINYDGNGNITSITPPGRPAHGFEYTAADQVEGYTPPNIGLSTHGTTIAYDLDGQVELVTRPDGQTVDPVYDPETGRLTSVITPRGSTSFGYHPTSGSLSSVTDPAGNSIAYEYDGALPTSIAWAGEVTGAVGFTYNQSFELIDRTVNGGDSVAFGRDDDGLLTSAGDLSLVRDPSSGFLSSTSLGSLGTSYTYDPTYGEITSFTATENGTEIFGVQYPLRDELGRIEQRVETIGGVATTYDYDYDLAGRLTDVFQDGVLVAHYDYDANSNRISWTDPWGSGTALYDDQDRLTDYAGTTYTYTANGELASKTSGTQTVVYDYDVKGNLRQVALPDGLTIDYVTDAANRRIGKKVNGVPSQGFLYQDRLNPVAELDGTGAVVATFVYADKAHVPAYMVKDGNTYRLITDHLGSVRLVVDSADGTIAQRLDYDAFGRVMMDTNPGFQPFGFAGGLYDPQTDLVRFGARDYDPETGRWTAKDPIGFAGDSLNLYGYTFNDPINFIDPLGLFGLADTPEWLVGALEVAGDFSSGFADILTVGIVGNLQNWMGVGHMVDRCSGAYTAGEWAGVAHTVASGAAGGLKVAGTKGAGREFSHWIPNRTLKDGPKWLRQGFGRSKWNGNYVTPARHYRHDPFRYPRGWRDLGPRLHPVARQLDRLPSASVGTGLGAGYGLTSQALNSARCGCG